MEVKGLSFGELGNFIMGREKYGERYEVLFRMLGRVGCLRRENEDVIERKYKEYEWCF